MKRTLIYSLMAAIVLLAVPAEAAKKEFKKSVRYEFEIDQNTLLEIVNRNGNIVIENTDDDHITIEAVVTGRGSNESEAERTCAKIVPSAVMSDNKISVSTEVPNSLRYEYFDLSYTIVMPAYTNINLSNKYGNVQIDRLNGRTSIKVGYGNLKIRQLNDQTGGFPVVDLAYSRESEINEINIGGVNMSYSGITIDRGQAVAVSSKYSKINVGSAASIAVESAYDNINIASTDKIDVSTRYTKLKIDFVEVMANIGIEYGSLNINGVGKAFKNITVNAKYTDTDIDMSGARDYSFDLKTKYGNITTPNHNLLYQEQISNDSNKSAKGRLGNADNGGKINVSSKYGNIKVKNNK
jgi:hypothetical protein